MLTNLRHKVPAQKSGTAKDSNGVPRHRAVSWWTIGHDRFVRRWKSYEVMVSPLETVRDSEEYETQRGPSPGTLWSAASVAYPPRMRFNVAKEWRVTALLSRFRSTSRPPQRSNAIRYGPGKHEGLAGKSFHFKACCQGSSGTEEGEKVHCAKGKPCLRNLAGRVSNRVSQKTILVKQAALHKVRFFILDFRGTKTWRLRAESHREN